MIIQRVAIENYLCYYGNDNVFEFSDGLNIILGENGEGKTKFFEAVDWLFNGNDKNLELLVSAKKLSETEIGESFPVKVSMTVTPGYGGKAVFSKSFIVQKEANDTCSISSYSLTGIEENDSGERMHIDGQTLLERVFPVQIRRYSMFKGESELNIFRNEDALISLINLFSDAKHYEKYSEKGAFLRENAEKAVEASTRSDKKNEVLYKRLESEISMLQIEKNKYRIFLNSTEEQIRKAEENIQEAEKHVHNADALETINKRITRIEEKISEHIKRIDENYTTALFDEKWITVNFEVIQNQFSEKVKQLSLEKRKLQSEHDREIGAKERERKAKAELMNNVVPLPIGVPSKAHMEEMLRDKVCKVCNREAPEGSDAYNFMMERLAEYLSNQEHSEEGGEEIEALFKHDYIKRLENLSVSHEDDLKNLRKVRAKIKEWIEFNQNRKRDIEELNEKLEKEKEERERILGSSSIGTEKLIDVLKNYNAWQRDLTQKNKERLDCLKKLEEIEEELIAKNKEKDNIDLTSANSFLIKTREILRDVETIFKDTKEQKFDEFIDKLETKSNNIFREINIDAFTGTIVFIKRNKGSKTVVDIELQEDGRTFYKPNQSLLTSMHISILFAISDLASEIKEENYPMIFDAPTSSFGENKTSQFLNLIYKTGSQKVLLIKDFLYTDRETNTLTVKKDFEAIKRNKAFWVKLERPFDPYNLKTINTQVINL